MALDRQALSFEPGGGALRGTIELSSQPAAQFSCMILLSYPSSALPDIVFGCPNAKLAPP